MCDIVKEPSNGEPVHNVLKFVMCNHRVLVGLIIADGVKVRNAYFLLPSMYFSHLASSSAAMKREATRVKEELPVLMVVGFKFSRYCFAMLSHK